MQISFPHSLLHNKPLCPSWFKLFTLTILILSSSCTRPTPASLPPDEIVRRSAEHMRTLAGFHFVIDRSGAPAYFNADETIAFRRAEGDFVSPDRARARVRVIGPGLVAEIQMVGIGPDYWETGLLDGRWQRLPAEQGFNPASLFDPQSGFQPILQSDLSDLKLAGTDEIVELPGKALYKISGDAAGENLYRLSYGLIGPARVAVTLWIAPDTFELQRVQIVEPPASQETPAAGAPAPTGEAAGPTVWQIDFWDFGKAADIQPPPVPTP